MEFTFGCSTNIGVYRKTNQDRACVRISDDGKRCLAVLCDGMGGLSQGEIASQMIVETLDDWFNRRFGEDCGDVPLASLAEEIRSMLCLANRDLIAYGRQSGQQIGSTASVLLLDQTGYAAVHAGDSRIYCCSDDLVRITDDDNVAGEKVRKGLMTEEEARTSSDQHMLTRCVGVYDEVEPHMYYGKYSPGDMFFLCCDGLYHQLSDQDIRDLMLSQRMAADHQLTLAIENLIDKVISKGEKDNITGVLVKVSE